MKSKVLTATAAIEQALSRFLIDIISIPSLSCQERDVARRIAEEMESLGYDQVRFDGLGSVIGRIGSGPRTLVFDGHIDTVDVGNRELWDFEPYDSREVNGWIRGRGASDQKGGVAAMVYAGKLMKDLGMLEHFTVYVTGTVMEEDCDGLCWQYLVDEEGLQPDFAVITEPTDLGIYRGQRGRMEIRLTAPGVSAHGSAPERGDNAITKMAPVVQAIDALNDHLIDDPFLGKGSAAVTEISSLSPSLCAIPDACTLHLDRRLTWGETESSALDELRGIMESIAGARIEVLDYDRAAYTGRTYPARKTFPAWKTDADHVLVRAAEETHRTLFDAPSRSAGRWTFSTNGVAICGRSGIPAVGFGPGQEAMAHAPNEGIPKDHLVRAAAFYALLPRTLGYELDATP